MIGIISTAITTTVLVLAVMAAFTPQVLFKNTNAAILFAASVGVVQFLFALLLRANRRSFASEGYVDSEVEESWR